MNVHYITVTSPLVVGEVKKQAICGIRIIEGFIARIWQATVLTGVTKV